MPGARAKPYALDRVLQNQLSTLLPLRRTNQQCYQPGYRHPSGDFEGYAPSWEVVTFSLPPRGTRDARVNFQRDFHLIGLTGGIGSFGTNGFRMQMYDVKKGRRFFERLVGHFNIAGGAGSILLLRRPYRFDLPDSQLLVQIQNLDTVQVTDQIVLYGCVLRFNDPRPWSFGRDGHKYLKRFLDVNLGWPWFRRRERKED